MNKKKDIEVTRENEYLVMLANRLAELRKEKGWSLPELKEKTGISRDKLNYAEINKPGRKLQIEELGALAKTYNVSIDYLLGLTNSKQNNEISTAMLYAKAAADPNNTMTENEILEQLNNGTDIDRLIRELRKEPLEIFDKLMLKLKENGLFKNLFAYIYISYIIENVLGTTLTDIKNKVKTGRRLEQNDKDKIKLLKSYCTYFVIQEVEFYDYNYIRIIAERNKEKFEPAIKECEKLLNYNENKTTNIKFAFIEELKQPFIMIAEELLYDIKEKQIMTSIKETKNNIVSNDKCCTIINQFIKQFIES